MTEKPAPQGAFALNVRPLSQTRALVLYCLLYVLGAFAWANLSHQSVEMLVGNWSLIAVFALPVALVAMRMLWRLLCAPWFAVAILASLVLTSAVASVALPAEAALARVYRTFPFAALGLTLAVSLAACVLNRPLTRGRLASIGLHVGLLSALAGAFASLLLRENATVTLAEGQNAAQAQRRDFRLVVTGEGDERAEILLPFEGVSPKKGRTAKADLGALRLSLIYEGMRGGGLLKVFAEGQGGADAVDLAYGGAPGELAIGEKQYAVSFGSSVLDLPFALTLEKASAEFYPGGLVPKGFEADIAVAPSGGGASQRKTIRVNNPAKFDGFQILLVGMGGDGTVTLEISRDPGAPVLFIGGAVAIAGFAASAVKRAARLGGNVRYPQR